MKINEFIKEYIEATDKDDFVRQHMTESYIGYASKVANCKRIVEATNGEEVNGKKIYTVDSTARFMLYTLMLVRLYTDIEIDSQPVVCFDLLSENGVIPKILDNIPRSEQKTFQLVFDMVRDDDHANNRDIVSYIDGKIVSFKKALDLAMDKIVEKINSEDFDSEDSENMEKLKERILQLYK
jgi:hypothetical protein